MPGDCGLGFSTPVAPLLRSVSSSNNTINPTTNRHRDFEYLKLRSIWAILHRYVVGGLEMKRVVTLYMMTICLTGLSQDVIQLGVSPETGLEEIRVVLPGLPEGAKPLDMVLIPAGTFTMGSPEDRVTLDLWWPPHEVTITRSFYLGKYEVTWAHWGAMMGYDYGTSDDHPVNEVSSWSWSQRFIDRLNEMGYGTFRLPTEAEWEYACRAGTTSRFSFGDALECDDLCGYCETLDRYMWWCGNNVPDGPKQVGTKLPNAWGLYDMHGNIAEWCSDWSEGPYDRGPQVDPQGPDYSYSSGRNIVLRSGWWSNSARQCRSAARSNIDPTHSFGFPTIGLRLLMLHESASGDCSWASYE